jgi:ferredoxin--NADP+ reductase
VRTQFTYYPTVTREPFRNRGRLTDLITSGQIFEDLGMPPLDAATDRAMICGSPAMLTELSNILDERKFEISPHIGTPGDYVIERAFVSK